MLYRDRFVLFWLNKYDSFGHYLLTPQNSYTVHILCFFPSDLDFIFQFSFDGHHR